MAKQNKKDMTWRIFQKERDEWKELKRDFINKRLQWNKERVKRWYEILSVFGRKIKPLPKEPVFTDYYHPSESQKKGEMTFIIAMEATLVSYLASGIFIIKWKS